MADGGRAIPQAKADDNEDVSWALSTADAMWNRGELADAIKWVRRAAEAASDAELDVRALELAKAAADLNSQIAGMPGNTSGSQRPPPLAGGVPQPIPPRASPSVTPQPPAYAGSNANPSSFPRRPSNAPPRPSASPAAGLVAGSSAPAASPSRPSPARASVPAPAPSQAPAARRIDAPRIASAPPAAKSSRPRPAAGSPPSGGPQSQSLTAPPPFPGQMNTLPVPGERTIADLHELDNPDDTQQVVVPVGPPRATRRPRPPDPTPPGPVVDSGYDPTHTQEQRSVQHPHHGQIHGLGARQPSAAEIDAWPTQAVPSEETEAGLAALVAKLPPMRKREPSRQPMDPDLLATQAVRVVVWRTADGVRVAPAGTVVSAIACDAVLVALDPTADLSAWLTNKP